VYNTVDNSTFLQIKGQPTAAKMWDKLVSIYGSKGSAQFEATLLGKLQNAHLTDDGDMRAHLVCPLFSLGVRRTLDAMDDL
jgi:hypothetical protein